jgi:hypothetical protein
MANPLAVDELQVAAHSKKQHLSSGLMCLAGAIMRMKSVV